MPIMSQLVPNRIVIYPKDVQNITGRKERAARKLICDISQELGKTKRIKSKSCGEILKS